MNIDDFITKVDAMRKAQKEYVKNHNPLILTVAMKLETIVDEQLVDIKNNPLKYYL